MISRLAGPQVPAFKVKPFNFWKALKELDMFYQGKDPVHQSMHRLVKRLEKANIPYAIMGGMAVVAHKHKRATNDVDVLMTVEGYADFRKRFVPKNYTKSEEKARRFVDKLNTITVDVLVTGLFPGTGQPGPIAFPDPKAVSTTINKVRHINLVTLIQLKLAAGRHRDFGDVVDLIRANDLGESFADRLHPSVRNDYIECLEEKRRDDVYDARQRIAEREELGKYDRSEE